MSPRERVRRLVDGELGPDEAQALEADATRDPALAKELEDARALARALSTLIPPEPPADLVDRAVLLAVQRRAHAEAHASFFQRWLRPHTIRVRLTPSALLAALAAVALLAVWLARPGEGPGMLAPSAPAAGAALVRLAVPAGSAETVAVAGDFNDWRTDDVFLEDPEGDGVFVGTLRLPPGSYAYMFVIDGQEWVTDPYAVNHRDDGFGNQNAVLRID